MELTCKTETNWSFEEEPRFVVVESSLEDVKILISLDTSWFMKLTCDDVTGTVQSDYWCSSAMFRIVNLLILKIQAKYISNGYDRWLCYDNIWDIAPQRRLIKKFLIRGRTNETNETLLFDRRMKLL
ncbi:MAG: hypothetical protein ACTS6H_01195 [Candidatus Hodgkinia cicadicola]